MKSAPRKSGVSGLYIILSAALVAGCTVSPGGPAFSRTTPAADRGVVYFFRPKQTLGQQVKTYVAVDGGVALPLAMTGYAAFQAPPGTHTFAVNLDSDSVNKLDERPVSITLEIKPGEERYLRIGFANKMTTVLPSLAEVPPAAAAEAIAALRLDTTLQPLLTATDAAASAPSSQAAEGAAFTLKAKDGASRYSVAVLAGGETRRCETPCTLPLSPGMAQLSVSGAGAFSSALLLPGEPKTIEITHRNNKRYRRGLTFLSVGVSLAVASTIFLNQDGAEFLSAGFAAAGAGVLAFSAASFIGVGKNALTLTPAE
jgi:hypothetical protein